MPVDAMLKSLRSIEGRMNHRYNYPYVFLNDEPFTTEFITQISAAVSGNVSFGLVPPEHWVEPDWTDLERAKQTRIDMGAQSDIRYGDSQSYRRMCRLCALGSPCVRP